MNKYFLTENFSMEENKEGSLVQTLVSVSNRTKFSIIEPAGITIYSLLRRPAEGAECLDFIKIMPAFADMRLFLPRKANDSYFSKDKGNVGTLPFQFFLDNGMSRELLDEIIETGYFLQIPTEMGTTITLVPAKGFLATLCRQLGVGKLEEGIDPMRDIYFASRMVYCEPFTLVYRRDGKFGKAFGCFSPKFGDLPQTLVLEFKDKLMSANPNMSVRHWEYTHSITSVDFSLNDKVFRVNGMRVTPGVRLSLSDIGDCSYTLRNVLYCNGSVVTLPESVSKKRSKNIDVKEMVTEFYKTSLPEMEKLIKMISNAANKQAKNKGSKVVSILNSLGFATAIGKTSSAMLYEKYEAMKEEASYEEILGEILKIPGNAKSKECKSCLNRVSECVGKVFALKEFVNLLPKEEEACD